MNLADVVPPNVLQQTFSKNSLGELTRPCVYMFLKDGQPLYIGSSINGILRFGSPDHHRGNVRLRADETLVLWLNNTRQARLLEGRLIRHFRPKYNGRWKAPTDDLPARRKREHGTGCLLKLKGCRYWYIQYRIDGRPIRESSKSESCIVAEKLLADRLGNRS